METQRAFLDSIGEKIGVRGSDLSPWYKLTWAALKRFGVVSLIIDSYNGSRYTMLRHVYPEYDWFPWRFRKLPKLVGKDPLVMERALKFVETSLNITGNPSPRSSIPYLRTDYNFLVPVTSRNLFLKGDNMEMWYEVSVRDLKDRGVLALFTQAGGIPRALKQYRPQYPWDESKFVSNRFVGEKTLGVYLRELWPHQELHRRFPLSPTLTLSFYLPGLGLAFDFQSMAEYGVEGKSGEIKLSLTEHVDKVSLAAPLGIRIVFVPFWWDRTRTSLASSALKRSPTLRSTLKVDTLQEVESFVNEIPTETLIRL